jgi:hypothetical protein
MQWDKNSCACFSRSGDERTVFVDRRGRRWSGDIWFAGRRKSLVLDSKS